MRKILIAATAAVLATGAGLFGASAADKLKIGFIYLGPVGDLGWTYQHDLGRLEMVKEFGDKVETTFLENVSEGPDSERSIEQLERVFVFRRRVEVLHEYPEQAMTPLASEHAVAAPALHDGSMAAQQTTELT